MTSALKNNASRWQGQIIWLCKAHWGFWSSFLAWGNHWSLWAEACWHPTWLFFLDLRTRRSHITTTIMTWEEMEYSSQYFDVSQRLENYHRPIGIYQQRVLGWISWFLGENLCALKPHLLMLPSLYMSGKGELQRLSLSWSIASPFARPNMCQIWQLWIIFFLLNFLLCIIYFIIL